MLHAHCPRKIIPVLLCALALICVGSAGIVVSGIGRHSADVWAHCYRISSILEGEIVAHPVTSTSPYHAIASENVGGHVPADMVQLSIDNAGNDPSAVNQNSLQEQQNGTYEVPFNNTAVYNPVAYAPQLIAFSIGDALGLTASARYYAAETTMLACFVAIGTTAVFVMPKHRGIMLAVLFFPLTWYVYSFAISADSFSLSLVFLFTALFYRNLEQAPSIRSSFALGIVGFLVAVTKFSNAPLFALALAIPVFHKDVRRTWPILMWFGFAVVADVLWMKIGTSGFATSPSVVSYAVVQGRNSELVSLVPTFLSHLAYSISHIEGAYRFGREGVAAFWIALVGASGFVSYALARRYKSTGSAERHRKLLVWLYACLVIFAFAVITYLALWLQYTPDACPGVDGIQYRYFLPVLPIVSVLVADIWGNLEMGRRRK